MDEISESLTAMIEYAEATKKYADAGSLSRVRDELDRLRTQADALAEALHHMHYCAPCGESSWEDCDGGRAALEALAEHEEGKK